jgi:CRISPR-associated protein Cmr2
MDQNVSCEARGEGMTQHMLLFSLGPVQSFIAQARKTRDLWLGSFLLSALMQAGMEDIKERLIFPSKPFIEGNIPDLPNKYIAIFDDADEAEKAARKSEERIIQFWGEICTNVWNDVLARPAPSNAITQKLWKEQTDPEHVFEFFWVVVPGDNINYPGDNTNYKEWLTEAQFALDGRKHLRNFQQQEDAGEKSTISGLRSALHGTEVSRERVADFWRDLVSKKRLSPRDISNDGAERLDAIDTVKRFASKHLAQLLKRPKIEAGYPSTSSIATAPYIERLITEIGNQALSSVLPDWMHEAGKLDDIMSADIPFLRDLAKRFPTGEKILIYDGDCFFPETFSANRLKKEFRFDDSRKAERDGLAQSGPKAIAKLLEATDKLTPPIARPRAYYAMIQMDGDKMGKLINGVGSKDEHKKISEALSNFSRGDVPAIVEKTYPGRLIYAGGDDVFALAPLARDIIPSASAQADTVYESKTVLDLVNQLQQRYRAVVGAEVIDAAQKVEGKKSRKELVTASAGIAIAHHYTSLSYVRRVSKEAEHQAKEHYGRNALVVTVLRRSGEQTRVGCHWHYPGIAEDEAQPIPLFLSFYELFKEDILSSKCVFTLLEEAPTLVALERDAQRSEIKRVLRRQRDPASSKDILSDDEIAKKAAYLVKLAEAMDEDEYPHLEKQMEQSVELHSDDRRYGLVEVLGWLLVMLFLARKEHE